MFMAFDQLSNSTSSIGFSQYQSLNRRVDMEDVHEKKESSYYRTGESGCGDGQSCDDSNEMKQSENRRKCKAGGEKKIKKHRYAFQTRSHVDILDDGYRWRNYGQKAVKNNKFPRSYYRCTHQGCNVKKQIQRVSKDEEVVITTYEGVHSHPIQKSTDNFEHILTQMQIYNTSAASL